MCVAAIKASKEYHKDQKFFEAMVAKSSLLDCLNQAEHIANSLQSRFVSLAEQSEVVLWLVGTLGERRLGGLRFATNLGLVHNTHWEEY